MDASPRELRLSSPIRSIIIAGLFAAYGYVFQLPEAVYTLSFLVAAGLQVAVLLFRKFVPTYLMPQALHVFELLADAATVFLFALGVYGGVLRAAYSL
jgi:hypothetical protein